MSPDEYADLMAKAREAYRGGDMWTAGLLYERAYQLAVELGDKQAAFDALREAADAWSYSADPDRGIRLLLEARQQLEYLHDAEGRYWLHTVFLMHAIDEELPVGDLDREMEVMAELAVGAWGAEGSRTLYFRSALFANRGNWADALDAAERSWAGREGPGPQTYSSHAASAACYFCLQLGRREEAGRWAELVGSTREEPVTPWQLAKCRCNLAQFGNDGPAARSASRQLDALSNPEMPGDALVAIEESVYSLLLSADEGDPADPAHLIRLRLAHQPLPEQLPFWFRYDWHRALACLELAGVRHAAGLPPVDDRFHAAPGPLPDPAAARLPAEVLPRLAAFDRACDAALHHAVASDTRFACTWRRQDLTALRRRGAAMAAVFRA